MTTTINVQEAKGRLSELLARAERGEDVILARAGTPVVRLAPVMALPERKFGIIDLVVPVEFFEPLDDAELDAWE